MKRRTEHLVEKRDGRREFLRATKLARSVHLALYEIGVDEDWRALELAGVVLEGLREKRTRAASSGSSGTGSSGTVGSGTGGSGGAVVLTTAEIADAVQHLLVVTGQPAAAVSYGAVQAERARRRETVAQVARAAMVAPAAIAQLHPPKAPTPRIGGKAGQLAEANSARKLSPKAGNRLGRQWPGEG